MKLIVAMLPLAMHASLAVAAPSAEELHREGKSAYESGDYATAIAKWKRSYKLSRAPLLLFNLAQAYRKTGDCAKALAHYKRFIKREPGSEVEPTAEQRLADESIQELEPSCGAETQPRAIDAPAPQPRGGTMRITGLVVGGAGMVSIGVGLVIGYRASKLGDEVERACTIDDPCDPSLVKVKDKDASGRLQTKIGWAFDVAGAAALVAGAALYYLGRDEGVDVAPVTGSHATGAVITWRMRW